ncbi:elongation factor P maturation arginine rhamnosyltransferase EarP [Chitinimonas arctica]|uniref:Protein-arginine rhamnosyltransferase n=1 Tax=Chitinimonas arctica TaxID=2594795 RepID=A0A516SB04_9NEIS|nr:elongation factor P maturation arginine rhamnosyltransferase EarP [Chitinimonas arctica]QDQ25329.1 elongation factor P maturation arginine rhamnosyltransferase EarP [Chitinimonas arctica]
MRLSWDIFCTVIDNFGDIGVCWRLARQLAAERGEAVRLWVDDPGALAMLRPELDRGAAQQWIEGVEIRHWQLPFPTVAPHQVVIEAFACHPPENFLAAMAGATPPPVWINLEYLSAEDWVEGCHGLGSRHPRLPLDHHFFFPGFTPATGGLLRESSLLAEREAWQAGPARHDWLQAVTGHTVAAEQGWLSLFCYDNAALPALLDHWQSAALCLLVAEGKPRRQVEAWLGSAFPPGSRIERGRLTLIALPFLSQDDYDRLLWSCELNFVRGEDSFVRAQWAARPLAWHIYPQEEQAHLVKLAAFLDRYTGALPPDKGKALQAFSQAWNDGDGPACVAAWPAVLQGATAMAQGCRAWCAELAGRADLMNQLAHFASEKAAHMGAQRGEVAQMGRKQL